MSEYRIEALDPAKHRRAEFRCESPELTEFLRTRARKEMEARASACFVLVPLDDPGRVAGYYTLSAAEVVTAELPQALARRLPRYRSLPATLLGRLARDAAFRGRGIGDRLMADALARALAGSAEIGAVAVVTDPKDERAARFYCGFGFIQLNDRRLFLSIRDVARGLQTRPA
jgi:GNAT superfamily N-acetyltransferase